LSKKLYRFSRKVKEFFDCFNPLWYNKCMNIYTYIFISLASVLVLASFCMYYLQMRINLFEHRLMILFSKRSDIFPWLYEVSSEDVSRHKEIFAEVLSLRKQEFWLMTSSREIEGYIQLQSHIHHEINFIFQVCNKNPKLLKNKSFLYLRDVMISASSDISKEMKKYRRIIEIYNAIIFYKNCTLIWLILPFTKKPVL
jgi:hypothetical protein